MDKVVRNSGFTFVELLIAATMIAILFTGLATYLRAGITVWQRATGATEALQQKDMAWRILERDLANAAVFDLREDAYGPAPKLPEPTFNQSQMQWFTRESYRRQLGGAVRFVSYQCGQRDGIGGLWRTNQAIGEARVVREVTPERLLEDCASFHIRYAHQPAASSTELLDWQEIWENAKTMLPRLIEVSMQTQGGKETTQLLTVPSGVLGPSQTGL
ncbi:MAG: prepilin-type N-terminal cleavage/methylation domain-containing protein [Candidatus Omnitrophica bacterium]|nr:prepilin-type N-terminal cleavage/methylation domain-containing protein [Candidatus Omnitrophota bacterium]MBI3009413.1 prepilin-type N-terminal cleavage/methylation domain-containing protein [Candidatus Omnitrophota bacterium]